mmetsp:Transcript_27249/g.44752  ORF Transcript_27249/g.44752 Transcript_27249/m.44752 type:complete len:243 (-) Transcript_27249:282-1010(-)
MVMLAVVMVDSDLKRKIQEILVIDGAVLQLLNAVVIKLGQLFHALHHKSAQIALIVGFLINGGIPSVDVIRVNHVSRSSKFTFMCFRVHTTLQRCSDTNLKCDDDTCMLLLLCLTVDVFVVAIQQQRRRRREGGGVTMGILQTLRVIETPFFGRISTICCPVQCVVVGGVVDVDVLVAFTFEATRLRSMLNGDDEFVVVASAARHRLDIKANVEQVCAALDIVHDRFTTTQQTGTFHEIRKS